MKTAMVDPSSSPTIQPPPPPRSNLPMLYYGLVVVATAAVMLVLYNLVVVKWCGDQLPHHRPPTWRRNHALTIFKYKRDGGSDSECAVCLSVFEEGEEMKQMPKCKHCFHALCIDMWLYSHFDCPLCRSTVEVEVELPVRHHHAAALELDHSRRGLLV